MLAMTTRRRALLSLVLAVVLVGSAACGGGDDDGDAGASGDVANVTTTTDDGPASRPTTSTTTAGGDAGDGAEDAEAFPPPVTAPLPSRGQPMADGVHAVFLEGTDVAAGEIVVDVIQFLTGEEADQAYREDTGDEGAVPNDFFIRNASQDQRTVRVSANVRVTVVWTGNEVRDSDVSFDELPAYLQSRGAEGADRIIFWAAVEYETVTRLYEQYVP